MKNSRPKSLPHPVLSPFSDDVSPNIFIFDCQPENISCDIAHWLICGEIKHENPEITNLVESGIADYGIHVECPRTFLRKWFVSKTPKITLELSAGDIWGKVELSAFCLAQKEIKKFSLSGQHKDYGKTEFQIRTGDILAFAPTVEFDAFLDIDPIRKISSILDIQKSKTRQTGPALINFEAKHIEVELPQRDYQAYIELRSDASLRGLLASNVVFPAILQAINHLHSLEEEQLEEDKQRFNWCRSLKAKLEKEGIKPEFTPEQIFESTQKILREPIRRGLNDIALQFSKGES
jgi:hypothetical protein